MLLGLSEYFDASKLCLLPTFGEYIIPMGGKTSYSAVTCSGLDDQRSAIANKLKGVST